MRKFKILASLLLMFFLFNSVSFAATKNYSLGQRQLSISMRGNDVMELQKLLKEKGFFKANTTGYFGPITKKAVINYQNSVGKKQANGIVDLATIKLLFNIKDEEAKKIKISILIPGKHNDNGFMEAAYRGYLKIKENLPVEVKYISDVSATSDPKVLTEAMRSLAKERPDLIIGHGGQSNIPAQTIAKEFPNIKFVVIQGNVKAENISSYVVRQEDSAWLAGALAGLTTKSNVVGHISGAWPKPGLIGRAAFYDGLKYVNPNATFLTWFTGNLDDLEINRQAAEAEINKGADVIYTMLNAGRQGVIEEIKKSDGKIRHIGNVSDWTTVDKSFIGSAVADSSVAIFNAASDLINGKWQANKIFEVGLDESDVVRLSMAQDVPQDVKAEIIKLANKIISGEIKINTEYNGKEFYPATGEFVDQSFKEELNKK